MSMIIKGIKNASACEWCRFISGSLEWYCEAGQFQIYDYKTIHKDCPLSKIPTPHGDLIDRDKLIQLFLPIMEFPEDERIMYVDSFIRALKNAPTIIEAEQDDG